MARSSAVIVIPGVLQKIVSAAPIMTGIQLYHGLAETFNLVLVTDDSKESTDRWLQLENLNKHGTVIYGEEKQGQRIRQVNGLRLRGFAIDLVVEPDPELAAELLRNGYTVCNFIHSMYAYPQFRPDFEGEDKGWERLKERAEIDALLRAADTRLDKDITELL